MATNVDKLRAAYQAWHDTRGASVQVWLDLLADDIQLRSLAEGAPEMRFSAPRRGHAEVQRYFRNLLQDWELLSYSADEFVSEGDRVVMIGRCAFRHRGTGKAVESPAIHLWRFRNGKAIEFADFYDTAKGIAAARSD